VVMGLILPLLVNGQDNSVILEEFIYDVFEDYDQKGYFTLDDYGYDFSVRDPYVIKRVEGFHIFLYELIVE